MTAISREFKGVWIPREIWLSEDLSIQEKIMIVEIDSLTKNDKGYCYASNSYFSNFFKLSKGRISQIISSLQEKGILAVWDVREGKQIVERRMKLDLGHTLFRKVNGGVQDSKGGISDSKGGYLEKSKERYTDLVIQKRDIKSTNVDSEQSPEKENSEVDLEETSIEKDIDSILEYWKYNDGKVHKSDTAAGAVKIRNMIYELLIDGRNPYIAVCKEPDLKFKKWTLKEIIECIDYYVDILNRDISNYYFNQFLVFTNFGKRQRSTPDFSPLVDSFLKIKDSFLDENSEKLKKKLTPAINGTPVYPKVFSKASKYVTSINEKYKVSDSACVTLNRSMLNAFVRYVEEKKNDLTWKIEYIAGDTFRDEFITTMLKRNVIMRKKAKRVDGKVIYY